MCGSVWGVVVWGGRLLTDPIPLHVWWWQNNMETRAFVFPCQSVPVVCGDASMRELCFYVFSLFLLYGRYAGGGVPLSMSSCQARAVCQSRMADN